MPADFRRIYLDANIIIDLVQGVDELHDRLVRLVGEAELAASPVFVTSQLTLAETLVRPYRNRDEDLLLAFEGMLKTNAWLEVAPVADAMLYFAAVLRAEHKSLKLPDAIHLSTAIAMECSHFLSADRGIHDRYELLHQRAGRRLGPVILDVIRPDEPTLTTLIESLAS
ncbi:type II toxin-antitoxin system VapC family toxin [Rhizobium halophytocola]|uniref:Nucleic acid-binding protein n=1 Tax=Rhizobium halophytocola TaxID=735519 RepID=A0ABS4E1B7_9HYPH|nr:type II toxin-antitoxin system VapC family toxin [Rhizobium halophytocola]MBP1851716.1 putative nucleic acid-binding protein [Rhizobium halophytocola]